MDDLEVCLAGAFGAVILVAALVWLITHEVRKGPRIKVPRETLWTRTNKYHEDRS